MAPDDFDLDPLDPDDDGELVPPEIAEQIWQDAVEAFHGIGDYAIENQEW